MDIFLSVLKLIIFLPLILFMIYFSLKYGGSKLNNFQNGKFIKIIERVNLSKDNSVVLTKLGEKYYILSSSNSNVEILKELTEEEAIKITTTKIDNNNNNNKINLNFFNRKGKNDNEKEN
ncbi:MAG: flagellar biosynthetic protein FliO [Clostridiaceae bacterium]